jgi:RNA polymerase-binding transcription factor DksA
MNVRRRTHFKDLLTAERKRVSAELERIAIAAAVDERDVANPGDEPEPGPSGGTLEDDAAIASRQSIELSNIDHALRLLDEEPDRFGICVTCGRRIGVARLEVVPATRYCGRHAPG